MHTELFIVSQVQWVQNTQGSAEHNPPILIII